MKKVLTIIGTRPEAIKMVPVLRAVAAHPGLESRLCITGQHRSMMDQVLRLFEIPVDHDLNIMQSGQSLTDITCRVLTGLEPVLKAEQPDWVLVHGDTTTTMAGALAAFYARVPIGHVEAGLRTGNLDAPWPEEANRKLTDAIARAYFAPTELACQNLLAERISPERVIVTGNTVIDTLQSTQTLQQSRPELLREYAEQFRFLDPSRRLILVTGHRRENFGTGFENICKALLQLAAEPGVEIVYPVHLNPNVRGPVYQLLREQPNIHLIEPLDYFPFVYLMTRAYLILTDSGGVQEEAPALGKPVLVMREVTERPEAIHAGTARLVGTAIDSIVNGALSLLRDENDYRCMATAVHPFGDGRAAERIAAYLATHRE